MIESIINEQERNNNIINAYNNMINETIAQYFPPKEDGEIIADLNQLPLEAKALIDELRKKKDSYTCRRNAYMDVFPEKGVDCIWPRDKDTITIPMDVVRIFASRDKTETYYIIAGTYVKAEKELSVEEYKQTIIKTCTELMQKDPAFAGKDFSDLQQAVEDARDKNRTL